MESGPMNRFLVLVLGLFAFGASAALDPAALAKLAGDNDEKVAAIGALVSSGDARALVVLKALAEGELQSAGGRVIIVKGDGAVDAATGEAVKPLPDAREEITPNNR